MARNNITLTVVAGTPINVSTGKSSAQMLALGYVTIPRLLVNRVFVQMLLGGTGVGYVMDGIRGITSAAEQWRVPGAAVSTDLTAQLAPATVTAPGGSYSDTDNDHGIDLSTFWIDGASNGDTVKISYDTRT